MRYRPLPYSAIRLSSAFILWALVGAAAGCGDDAMPTDGGADADTGPGPVICRIPDLRFALTELGSTVGISRNTYAELSVDRVCDDLTVDLTSSDPAVATVPETLIFPADVSRAYFDVTPVAIGTTTITATVTIEGMERTDTFDVQVVDAALPTCDGDASGNASPGGEVTVASGSLTGAGVAVPEGASRDDAYHVDAFDVTIACAADQLPTGYRALGPAVAFGPGYLRFGRELPMSIPIHSALLPDGANRGHVEMSYTGPGVTTPRIVPVAVVAIPSGAAGLFRFEAPRLGTYQAVVRETAGTTRPREFMYRGILGASMGAIGTGVIAYRNAERFDFAAPLGAAWDWAYLTDYMLNQHMGGFCTDAERTADPGSCNAASTSRTPPAKWMHETSQDYEHWWYDENIGGLGHGSAFDRREYTNIFTDISMMYGNPNTDATADGSPPNVLPPGIPDSERMRSNAERCATPVSIPPYDGSAGTGFFDDEYNPEGLHPVISFCDGAEVSVDGERDLGVWDPAGSNDYPMGVVVAVDVNANGVRDPGEPVIRNFREAFEDCGMDRLCNPAEAGYDAVTNPDPAEDDYDYQYNPTGTEGNFLRDGARCDASDGEAFVDDGLDGIPSTAQLTAGGFDNGEGDGCWTTTHGLARLIDRGPKHIVLNADESALRDLDVFGDGGIRDLFMAGPAANHSFSAFSARGMPLRYHNGHSPFHLDGRPNEAENFIFTEIDWLSTGQNVMVRYGDPDASPGRIGIGDGAHVGATDQVINRVLAPMVWMSQRWPGGDRRRVDDRLCRDTAPGCDNPNQILLDFTSPTTGRSGPVSVILPPGYYDDEYADVDYPVIYFLHGYGMDPTQLVDVAVLTWNFMIAPTIPESQRMQKMIFVFPDGECAGAECVKGTFYTDAPVGTPGGAQMETFLLDLMDHVDATYRTRAPQTVDVIQ
ncbi:MAG: hypothetical protein DRJ42_12240 [Deltaproteobacteria bacterium]|nr:MAG: hypothetical protein DRJ42_12240 [Deltaproteobacteria bacterium]